MDQTDGGPHRADGGPHRASTPQNSFHSLFLHSNSDDMLHLIMQRLEELSAEISATRTASNAASRLD